MAKLNLCVSLKPIFWGKGRYIKTPIHATKPARVASDLSAEFSEAVISLQENRNGGRVIGEDIVNLVKEKYDVQYSVSGIYKVLSRMGLSWVSGRSIHPKSNLKAQEAFKKTLSKP